MSASNDMLEHLKDIEQGLIGAALSSGNWKHLHEVQPQWFNDPRHQHIWHVFSELDQSGTQFDNVTSWSIIETINEQDRRGIDRPYIGDCVHKAPSVPLIPDYIKQLKDAYVDRELGSRIERLSQLRDGKADRDVILSEIEATKQFLNTESSTKGTSKRLVLTPYSQIEEEPSYMLWEGYIPARSITMLGGGGGSGKTTLALQIAGQVIKGTLEGDYYGKPGKVAYLGLDDSKESITRPRARAAGVDLNEFYDMSARDGDKELTATSVIDVLGDLKDTGVTLVILDPVSALFQGDNDNPLQVERFVQGLTRVAEQTGVTFLCLSHVKKGGGRGADALLGSTKWRDSARSLLLMAKKPDAKESVVSAIKFNHGEAGKHRLYMFDSVPLTIAGVQHKDVGVLRYVGESDVSAESVTNYSPTSYEDAQETEDKAQWLLEQFTGQTTSIPDSELSNRFRAAGLGAKSTYQRAKNRAGLVTERVKGFQGGSIVYSPGHVPPSMDTGDTIKVTQSAQPNHSDHNGETVATFPHSSNVSTMRSHSGQTSPDDHIVTTMANPLDSNENKPLEPHSGHDSPVKQASEPKGTCPLHQTPLDKKGGCDQCKEEL
ncbi:AAA family ATPase [Arcanobacterium pinnipediorum]|uniref:AAA family ATPase n=1 Tax=Arcanobacterium pinnipediorum TaxID=1503041 RepID=A0ABY5AHV0_9ACTO|nr:AAA family ATPase [Arcanobacterium pinnipediorum]USR79301.1 AAA family ATPase [Arcanobacterium pinnipediorum]